MKSKLAALVCGGFLAGLMPVTAWAQDSQFGSLEGASLKSGLQQRYDAALAATLDTAIVNADDPRYLWASEAKAQCAIALGYLKSSTRDEVSIGKCAMAADYMMRAPAPKMAIAPTPQPPAAVCTQNNPGLVFFDFDSDVVPADARQTVQFVSQNAGPCGWRSFDVVGHADRSGGDAYNQGLSRRRAEAVATLMASMGLARNTITTGARGESQPRVPTADGVREPQNRRVEITVK